MGALQTGATSSDGGKGGDVVVEDATPDDSGGNSGQDSGDDAGLDATMTMTMDHYFGPRSQRAASPADLTANAQTSSIVVADFNDDHKLDIAALYTTKAAVAFFVGN